MIDPCFVAMLEGAVIATNPPTGLTAVPQDGSSASSQMNAIFAALPHANSNSANVLFLRPSTRYKINARLDITKHGTSVLCGGAVKITLKNVQFPSFDIEDPWFRGSGLSPHVRMDNVEHCLWHGGGFMGRDTESGGSSTQTFIEMGSTRFCAISNVYNIRSENIAQIAGLTAGTPAELCEVRDCHWWKGNSTRPVLRVGSTNIRSNTGRARVCGGRNFWSSGGSNGPTFDQADDWFHVGGYSEFHGGNAAVCLSGCARVIWIGTNIEGTSGPLVNSGASLTSIGHGAWGTGGGDFYVFGF